MCYIPNDINGNPIPIIDGKRSITIPKESGTTYSCDYDIKWKLYNEFDQAWDVVIIILILSFSVYLMSYVLLRLRAIGTRPFTESRFYELEVSNAFDEDDEVDNRDDGINGSRAVRKERPESGPLKFDE